MLKSKFIDIIRTFSKAELKQFRIFLGSTFNNTNKNAVKLFDIIRKYAPLYDSPALKKEKLFSKLYPQKKYSDIVIRILLSELLKIGKEFLVINRARIDRFGSSLTLLQELKDRRIDRLFLSVHKDTDKYLSTISDIRTRYFSLFELEVVNVDFHLRINKQQQVCQNILNRSENLIYFMLIETVRNIHDLIINEKTFNVTYDFKLAYEFFENFNFKAILENLKRHRSEHFKIIYIYYNLLSALIREEDDDIYDILQRSIKGYMASAKMTERNHLLQYLETCCLLRMNINPDKYRKEIFYVYEMMLRAGLYSDGTEEMTVQRFKNIFIAALNINELKWADNFCLTYIPKIQSKYRESMKYYCNALLYFMKNDFKSALRDLSKVKTDYFILKLDIKSWTLKIYYELKYYEQLLSHMDSYRHFLSKNSSLSANLKQRHRSFLKFTSEILKIKNDPDSYAVTKLADELSGYSNIVHKDWIKEKISELNNNLFEKKMFK